jgi:aspartate oxidase
MSCLLLCAFKKDLIAFTATHGYEISEEQFTPFHPILIVPIENVHVIVNVIVRGGSAT